MKIESNYDWIVIGEHPAALLSGCLAARLGLRVLAVPFFRRSSGFLSKSGQYIDLESNRVLAIGGDDTSEESDARFLEKILVQLCEVNDLSRADFQLKRSVTIETPHSLVNWNKNQKQMSRGFIRNWVNQLSLTDAAQTKKIELHSASEDILVQKAVFALFSNRQFHFDSETLSNLKEVSEAWASIRGGRMAYQRLLRLKGAKWGIQFVDDHECRRIFAKEGRITGVQLAGKGELVATRGAALGVPLDMVKESVHGAIKSSPKASFWKMTLALTVDESGLPPGISDVHLWQEPESSAIEIEWAYPKDYGVRLDGVRYVFLRTQLPYNAQTLAPQFQRQMAARMYKKFQDLFPFVDRHVLKMFPDFKNSVDEFSEAYGYAAIEMVPEFLKIYETSGVTVNSGIEGLFVTNSEAYPELGDFGGTRSAVEAVTWLALQSGLKGALL